MGESLLTVIQLVTQESGPSLQATVREVLAISPCYRHPMEEESLSDMLELLHASGHHWERRGNLLVAVLKA